jgi:hypothetical protein
LSNPLAAFRIALRAVRREQRVSLLARSGVAVDPPLDQGAGVGVAVVFSQIGEPRGQLRPVLGLRLLRRVVGLFEVALAERLAVPVARFQRRARRFRGGSAEPQLHLEVKVLNGLPVLRLAVTEDFLEPFDDTPLEACPPGDY